MRRRKSARRVVRRHESVGDGELVAERVAVRQHHRAAPRLHRALRRADGRFQHPCAERRVDHEIVAGVVNVGRRVVRGLRHAVEIPCRSVRDVAAARERREAEVVDQDLPRAKVLQARELPVGGTVGLVVVDDGVVLVDGERVEAQLGATGLPAEVPRGGVGEDGERHAGRLRGGGRSARGGHFATRVERRRLVRAVQHERPPVSRHRELSGGDYGKPVAARIPERERIAAAAVDVVADDEVAVAAEHGHLRCRRRVGVVRHDLRRGGRIVVSDNALRTVTFDIRVLRERAVRDGNSRHQHPNRYLPLLHEVLL